ncbi:hypothetical protein MAR_036508 [Mya arenaria]|uniref:Uncharacterized protein n=1 Tax=Mya arenaria TaxID=6604 RepID=A0ABY7FNX5_MYAAR|nr:hypothetical protein MAR_036508 [Mya arenaria]
MAIFNVPPPDNFNFKRPEKFDKWFQRFKIFSVASGLNAKKDNVKINTFLYCMGKEAEDILKSVGITEENAKVYKELVKAFKTISLFEETHSLKKQYSILELNNLDLLFVLSEHCGYGELNDERIRDRIVVVIQDIRLSEKLQLDHELTLENAIN